MKPKNTEKLTKFLKEQATNTSVLFYDNIDKRRIDLRV